VRDKGDAFSDMHVVTDRNQVGVTPKHADVDAVEMTTFTYPHAY
jgi:hypothetical protein